ncbi:MAG: 16S rRNA (cytidine(1402)-2'-O)-methyltransferase [Candidatus Dojkabacteria bacterium]|nr:16S rRNA (cytidine(1402)-2'-O)-methyltransferase [Candidatus Dojkabacteria bacterium]
MAKLVVVGTPIGNLEDISIRIIKAIFSTNTIIAEDTRNFKKLVNLLKKKYLHLIKVVTNNQDLEINKKRFQLISYREQNHIKTIYKIISILKNEDCLLVSDSGMPTISDPGYLLIKECINSNIDIEIIPSASAYQCGLILSGLPTYKFTFLGFLPRSKKKIQTLIKSNIQNTICFYESPNRILSTLKIIREISENFRVSISKELTKKYENTIRGKIDEIISFLSNNHIRGEITVTIYCNSKN